MDAIGWNYIPMPINKDGNGPASYDETRQAVRAFDARHALTDTVNSVETGLMATVGDYWEEKAANYVW